MSLRSLSRYLFCTGAIVVVTSNLAGCGGTSKPAIVEGKVTINGSPLRAGIVAFTSASGETISGEIQSDGTYRVVAVPVGAVQVTVTATSKGPNAPSMLAIGKRQGAKDVQMPPGASSSESSVIIPQKYSNISTSGLATNIKSGKNTYPIELSSN